MNPKEKALQEEINHLKFKIRLLEIETRQRKCCGNCAAFNTKEGMTYCHLSNAVHPDAWDKPCSDWDIAKELL